MFCPKCGLPNSDDTKFCRGCGVNLSYVPAALQGRPAPETALAEKYIDLYSSALRWLIIGIGFLIVSGVSFAISLRLGVLGIFALAFGFAFLGTGVARFVQARSLKALREAKDVQPVPALSAGETEYVQPDQSIYETDDLVHHPASVTEHTTTHLKKNSEPEV